MFEWDFGVEEEDSDNGDGSASIKRPLHAGAGCTRRSSSKIGMSGLYSAANEMAASSL